jgi:hypothetical protein
MRPLKRAANCRTFRQDMFVPGRTSRPSTTSRKQERRLISIEHRTLSTYPSHIELQRASNEPGIYPSNQQPTNYLPSRRAHNRQDNIDIVVPDDPSSFGHSARHPNSSASPPNSGKKVRPERRCERLHLGEPHELERGRREGGGGRQDWTDLLRCGLNWCRSGRVQSPRDTTPPRTSPQPSS